jgi:hypothetical protein
MADEDVAYIGGYRAVWTSLVCGECACVYECYYGLGCDCLCPCCESGEFCPSGEVEDGYQQ